MASPWGRRWRIAPLARGDPQRGRPGAYGRTQRHAAANRQSYYGVALFGFRHLDIEV